LVGINATSASHLFSLSSFQPQCVKRWCIYMNRSMKAALLSAFVFPGVGHVYLKRYISGTLLAGTALIALYFAITAAVERALQIVDKIQSGEIQPDVAVITELVTKQATGADAKLINIATAVLIITWLIGIVDSYRVGRLQDGDAVADGD